MTKSLYSGKICGVGYIENPRAVCPLCREQHTVENLIWSGSSSPRIYCPTCRKNLDQNGWPQESEGYNISSEIEREEFYMAANGQTVMRGNNFYKKQHREIIRELEF